MLPQKMLKFYSHRDVFSYILKLQTMTFNNQKKITFLDNLIDLTPMPTTQIGLFGSLLIALLIIIFTQSRCQHLSRNQSHGQSTSGRSSHLETHSTSSTTGSASTSSVWISASLRVTIWVSCPVECEDSARFACSTILRAYLTFSSGVALPFGDCSSDQVVKLLSTNLRPIDMDLHQGTQQVVLYRTP